MILRFFSSLILLYFINASLVAQPPGITLVRDNDHTKTSVVETYSASVSTSIKALLENGFIEKISKVQTFFKEASEFISKVVANLKMTKELIETEKDIQRLFIRYLDRLDSTEDFKDKWKYRWILLQLAQESTKVFEIFDIAYERKVGILDDKGRIHLIKHTLKEAKKIKTAMKTVIKDTNRQFYTIKKFEREVATFSALFEELK